ncbi:MAG TPA: VOC family protein [Solirubrobacterales bacterium]|jgi:catechol 2,3-dioxygenase-like lactoylglutathione lyase family enzyme
MAVERMDHVGIVVDDLAAAIEFFTALGLEPQGDGMIEGDWVDRIVGLDGVRSEIAMLEAPGGRGKIELVKFHSPAIRAGDREAPSNAAGIRHLCFAVDDLDATLARLESRGGELVGTIESYSDAYRLCYVRGPEGVIVELAERLG